MSPLDTAAVPKETAADTPPRLFTEKADLAAAARGRGVLRRSEFAFGLFLNSFRLRRKLCEAVKEE